MILSLVIPLLGIVAPVASLPSNASVSEVSAKLELCEQRFRSDPFNYETSRCFFQTPQNPEEIEEARQRLAYLQQEFPDNCRLDVIQTHFIDDAEYKKKNRKYEQAADKAIERGDLDCAIIALNNICIHEDLFGDPKLGDAPAYRILELSQRASDKWAVVARARSDFANHFVRANRKLGEAYDTLRSLQGADDSELPYNIRRDLLYFRARLARVFFEYERAEEDYKTLLEIATPRSDKYAILSSRQGRIIFATKKLAKRPFSAELQSRLHRRFLEALDSARELGHKRYEALFLEQYARFLAKYPETQEKARTTIDECLSITANLYPKAHGSCFATRSSILAHSDPQQALDDAQVSVEHLMATDDPHLSLLGWRQVMRRFSESGYDEKTIAPVAQMTLDNIESMLPTHVDARSRRQFFSRWTSDYHWFASRLLESAHPSQANIRQAFEISDRTKARYSLDFFRDDRQPVQLQIGKRASPRAKLSRSYEIYDKPSSDEQPFDIERDFDDWYEELKSRYAKRSAPQNSFSKILQQGLDADEVLISFQVSSPNEEDGLVRAYIVSSNAIRTVPLKLRSSQLTRGVHALRAMIENRDPNYASAQRVLRKQLIDPLLPLIPQSAKRWIISPDGPLSAMPFSLLIPEHPIWMAGSARTFLAYRSQKSTPKKVRGLVVVDPRRRGTRRAVAPMFALRSWSNDLIDNPLPRSREEIAHIRQHFSDSVEVLVGEIATKENLQEAWSAEHNFLHISTHSVVLEQTPDESALVLANSAGENDGLLRIRDIEAMDLDHTLVVLGGCSTGRGARVDGEGILSIASAFQRAGSPVVLASLWPVLDEPSAEFFDVFYRELGQGKSPAQALFDAQQHFRRAGQNVADYAGFVILGDGSQRVVAVTSSPFGQMGWLTGILGAFLALGVAYLARFRIRPT